MINREGGVGGPECLDHLFLEYGIWRFSEILYAKLFPRLSKLEAQLSGLRRKARNEGMVVREAKELFLLDMVLTSLYVLPLAVGAELISFLTKMVFVNFDTEVYFVLVFFFAAPAIGVTFVMGVESARATVLGVSRGRNGKMFAFGRNLYLAIHLPVTFFVMCVSVVSLLDFF